MNTLLASLAEALRALPDEELVEVGAVWIAQRVRAAVEPSPSAPPPETARAVRGRPTSKREPRPRAARAPSRAKAVEAPEVRRTNGGAAGDREVIFRALAGAEDGLSVSQLVEATRLRATLVKQALYKLRREQRAELEGRATSARWRVAA